QRGSTSTTSHGSGGYALLAAGKQGDAASHLECAIERLAPGADKQPRGSPLRPRHSVRSARSGACGPVGAAREPLHKGHAPAPPPALPNTHAATCVRDVSSSLARIFSTCLAAVASLTINSVAIWRFVSPRATSWATSHSRIVNGSWLEMRSAFAGTRGASAAN